MTRYLVDPDRTIVWIDARSSLHPVNSETRGLEGFFEGELGPDGLLDLSSPTQASLSLPVAKMSSGNALYDREMMRRVDARRHPTITATLCSLTAAGAPGRYVAEGAVTFKGVTQKLADEVSLSRPSESTLVFEGRHVFQLPDFGMQPPRIMMLKVYPDVTVRVRIVVVAS